MKLVVVGFGQCGGRIADEFTRLNRRAHVERGVEIVAGVYAVNTDTADLSGLKYIKEDYQHRILLGGKKTRGHGVAKINEFGAEIAREDGDRVIEAIRTTPGLYDTDAFLVIAGAAGGTGSGSISVITRKIRERYPEKPAYAIIVLPFEHEETTEERTVFNTAVCLKSIFSVADAVILVDNQRYIRKDAPLGNNISGINKLIIEPFYNLLCAGEEKNPRRIGTKVLDAGDILQTLSGWTVLGYGKTLLPRHPFFFKRVEHFREKNIENHGGLQSMEEVLGELSMQCGPQDAGRALYLISAPANEMNMDLIKALGDRLRAVAPNAIIRNGDYPIDRGMMDLVVILSQLKDIARVRDYYTRSIGVAGEIRRKQEQSQGGSLTEGDSGHLPTLL